MIPLDEFHVEAARLEPLGQSLYYRDDAHWTPQGHHLAARLIADHLAESLSTR